MVQVNQISLIFHLRFECGKLTIKSDKILHQNGNYREMRQKERKESSQIKYVVCGAAKDDGSVYPSGLDEGTTEKKQTGKEVQ